MSTVILKKAKEKIYYQDNSQNKTKKKKVYYQITKNRPQKNTLINYINNSKTKEALNNKIINGASRNEITREGTIFSHCTIHYNKQAMTKN